MKNSKINGKLALAPMAGVADVAFREICEDFGASLFTSELVSVKGLIYNSEKTKELLLRGNLKKTFGIQLFGNIPEDFAKATIILKPFDFDIIDINMGCPMPKVTKEGAGSALLKDPVLCEKIVKAIKNVTEKPVTIKIRSGWDSNNITAIDVAKICENAGANAITIHGRTRTQMYSGTVDLEIIKKVKNAVKIPVIGNGNIIDSYTAKNMFEYTNCDMIAIGRAAYGNPFIFAEINSDLFPETYQNYEKIDKKEVLKKHIKKLCIYKGELRGLKEARKHIAWYIKNIPNASELRQKAYTLKTLEDFEKFLNQF